MNNFHPISTAGFRFISAKEIGVIGGGKRKPIGIIDIAIKGGKGRCF